MYQGRIPIQRTALSLTAVLLSNLLSLSLVFAIALYRTEFTVAQGNDETADTPVLDPRNA